MKKYFNSNIWGYFFGGILFLCLLSPAYSEEISLSAGLDKTDIAFEDSLSLTVILKWQGDIRKYAFEILPLPKTEKLKVVGTSSAIASGEEDKVEITKRTFRYTLKPTLSGVGVIEPIVLKYISWPDSIPGELTTQQFKVMIADPLPPPKKSEFPMFWLILIIFVIVIIIIFMVIKKRRPQGEPEKTAEKAFRDGLKKIKDGAQSDRKTFFTKLYKLLSVYIEVRYKINTVGKTAVVISEELDKLDIPLRQKEKLIGWMMQAETGKFAPLSGTPGDIIRLITELENFFQEIDVSNKSEAK